MERRDQTGRRAQLQTMEPIMVVMVLAMIGGVALLFFTRINDDAVTNQASAASFQQDTALLAAMSRMPELSCTIAETSDTKCLDIEKVKAFSKLLKSQDVKKRYYPLFANTDISTEYIPANDADDPPAQPLVLYEGMSGENSRQTRTYFVLYDPGDEKMMFATLVVNRGVR